MKMECMGCGKYIDEDKETIAHDYAGNEYHESCLQEETKESEAYALARGVQ